MTLPAPPLAEADLQHVLDGTRPLWEDMRGQRLLLTGGTGFFGCWLLETFRFINRGLELNARVTVLTRDPVAFTAKAPRLAHDPAVTLLAGDVGSFAFPDGEFSFVLHAATEASARQAAERPLEMWSTIVEGTEHVLQFAASHAPPHRPARLLLTSSGAIYGPQPSEITRLPETYLGAPDPRDPASVYGEGKRAAEQLCALYARVHGVECAIARCWAFCGPYLPLDAHFAIGNFIGDALARRPIRIHGDGTPRRSYLYGADLAVWLWTMLFRAPSLVPVNVGSAEDFSLLEVARAVAAELCPETSVEIARTPTPDRPPGRYVPSVERARALLGLTSSFALEETIRRTAAWHRARTSLPI